MGKNLLYLFYGNRDSALFAGLLRFRFRRIFTRRPDKAKVNATISLRRLLNRALTADHFEDLGNLIFTNIAVNILAPAELKR
jgi:hypothetical protein